MAGTGSSALVTAAPGPREGSRKIWLRAYVGAVQHGSYLSEHASPPRLLWRWRLWPSAKRRRGPVGDLSSQGDLERARLAGRDWAVLIFRGESTHRTAVAARWVTPATSSTLTTTENSMIQPPISSKVATESLTESPKIC